MGWSVPVDNSDRGRLQVITFVTPAELDTPERVVVLTWATRP